jgi:hypothetical protein
MAWRISSFDMAFLLSKGIWNCELIFQAVVELVFHEVVQLGFRLIKKPPACGWLTGYSNVVERFLDCEDYIYSVFLCALCGKRLCFFR